jgi:hypothetical protein
VAFHPCPIRCLLCLHWQCRPCLTNGPCPQEAHRHHRLLHQDQHINRVAVLAQGLGHKAVVVGINDRAEQDAVHIAKACKRVQLAGQLCVNLVIRLHMTLILNGPNHAKGQHSFSHCSSCQNRWKALPTSMQSSGTYNNSVSQTIFPLAWSSNTARAPTSVLIQLILDLRAAWNLNHYIHNIWYLVTRAQVMPGVQPRACVSVRYVAMSKYYATN